MALFKKEEPKSVVTPTDKILDMRNRGMSDNQIVQQMQREGYSSESIFNALSQADLRGSNSAGAIPPPMPEMDVPDAPQFRQPQNSYQSSPAQSEPQNESNAIDEDRIEEIAESIIDEKWDEIVKSVNKIIDWKNDMDAKISEIEEKALHLQDNFDKLHRAVIGKIDDYDKTLMNVGAEIKAMNEIFQKILPVFTDNVQTLQRVTQKISQAKEKEPAKKK